MYSSPLQQITLGKTVWNYVHFESCLLILAEQSQWLPSRKFRHKLSMYVPPAFSLFDWKIQLSRQKVAPIKLYSHALQLHNNLHWYTLLIQLICSLDWK